MKVDPKSISADPFPRVVNRDLRYLVALREEETAERAELFDERDGLLAELEDLDEDSEDAQAVEVKHSRVVRKIERKAKTIAWCNQQIGKLVKKADDRTLYSDSTEVPPPEPPASLFSHKKGAGDDVEGDDDDMDERPVGEPAAAPADDEEGKYAPGAKNTARMRAEEAAEQGIERVDPETGEISKPARKRTPAEKSKSNKRRPKAAK